VSDDAFAETATSGPDSGPVRAPQQLGRYQIVRELGAGAMGVVVEARDTELERRVALKLLKTSRSDDAKARLLREARAMASLPHAHVVTIYDVGTIEGQDYVAMEIVDGGTLASWLATRPSATAIIDAFVQAGRGLAAAHAAGIVHRDFKPHNVLRTTAGAIKVSDFGLARPAQVEARALGGRIGDPMLTATGSLLGTPAYMAPEQWDGGEVGPAADQWAFCVSLWEAFAGARPFGGTTLDELRTNAKRGPAALDASALPRRLRPIVLRGLAVTPANRWPDMPTLVAALAPRPDRRPLVGILAAAALFVSGIALATRHHEPDVLDVSKIQRLSDGSVHAPAATVHAIEHELRAPTSARLVPAMKNGAPEGLKVYALHAGTLLDAIGISNGDTIAAIDGHPTPDIGALDAAVREDAPELTLTVIARGVTRTIHVSSR
jgi:serine/threonine protein kinase